MATKTYYVWTALKKYGGSVANPVLIAKYVSSGSTYTQTYGKRGFGAGHVGRQVSESQRAKASLVSVSRFQAKIPERAWKPAATTKRFVKTEIARPKPTAAEFLRSVAALREKLTRKPEPTFEEMLSERAAGWRELRSGFLGEAEEPLAVAVATGGRRGSFGKLSPIQAANLYGRSLKATETSLLAADQRTKSSIEVAGEQLNREGNKLFWRAKN